MKNLDFMKEERRKYRQEAAGRRGKTIMSLLPLVLMMLYLQNYIHYMEKSVEMGRQISEVQQFLNNSEILESEERLEELYKNRALLEQYETEMQKLRVSSEERAVLTADVLYKIEALMEGRVEMVWDERYPIHFEEGVLKFTVMTTRPMEASEYIKSLELDEEFNDVEYKGFERRRLTEEGELVYLFDVTCRLTLPKTGKKEGQDEKNVET